MKRWNLFTIEAHFSPNTFGLLVAIEWRALAFLIGPFFVRVSHAR